jgi:hypothetical protein
MQWQMHEFESKERPPFSKVPSSRVLRGITHYDWSKKAMTEIYYDKCIDIFPKGRDYRCQFTSLQEQTYFIRFEKMKPASCCLWSKEGFHAPRPDVIRNMSFDKNLKLAGKDAEAWVLDIPLPGPFGYAFFKDSDVPATFWFPVISGWVQQDFNHFERKAPAADAFDLPDLCKAKDLKSCE